MKYKYWSLTYDMYKLIYKKASKLGLLVSLPTSFVLNYELTYNMLKHINSYINDTLNYSLFYAFLPYIIGGLHYWFSTAQLEEYYTIMFKSYEIINNPFYIKFKTKIKENNTTRYIFKCNKPISELLQYKDRIEQLFSSHVLDIKNPNGNIKEIEILTSHFLIDYKSLIHKTNKNYEKIIYAMDYLNIKYYNLNTKDNDYKTTINFDLDLPPKELYKQIDYLKHLTKLDLILGSGNRSDFNITINKTVKNPSFFTALKELEYKNNDNMFIGYNQKGKPITLNIRKLYHSIVSGSTGKGKSNLAHIILSSLFYSKEDIIFYLFDTKKSELKRYRDLTNVIYEGDKIKCIELLENLVQEMENRNNLFEPYKLINGIDTYNVDNPGNKLPYIVIYIEEIADLLKSTDKDISDRFNTSIERITQLGRSSGFRVFLSTQYPKAEIINTIIKLNCDTKFALGVPNKIASNLILDSNSCMDIPIGKMIFKNGDKEQLISIPYLEDQDIKNVVDYLEELNFNTKYPLSDKHISTISNAITPMDKTVSLSKNNDTTDTTIKTTTKTAIHNSRDLLEFYKLHCTDKDNSIYTISKTVELVTIGKTLVQKYRKELIDQNYFYIENQKCFWNKIKLKLVK